MRRLFSIWLCLLLAIAGPAGAGEVPAPGKTGAPSVVPLQLLKSRHLAVEVTVNGRGPLRLILDTGSPVTLLSNAAAIKVGLLTADAAQHASLLGIRAPVEAQSLAVGDAVAHKVPVLILDHPTIALLAQVDGPVDGILGFSFFARFRTIIDYAAGTASFAPVDYHPRDLLSDLMRQILAPPQPRRIPAPSGLWGITIASGGPEAVLVTRVYPGGAAALAGLRAGDRITELDGRWTDNVAECYEAAGRAPAGTELEVKILRSGVPRTLRIKPTRGL